MANLLDYVGLGHFLEKIKTLFVTGLGTSGNSLTWTKNGTTNNITIPYASKSSELIPLQTKLYTGVIGTANDNPGAVFYFMSIHPEDWNKPCRVTYRIYAEMDGLAAGKAFSIMSIVFSRNTAPSYDVWNYIGHTDYRPYYYHYRYLATATGYNNNYGHLMGIGLNSSYSPTTATYARNFTVDILEVTDCTVTLFDTMTKYANVPGTGSTNYSGETIYNATTLGETHSGDANDVNYYNREYYGSRKTNSALYRYMLCLTKSDGSLVPMNSVSNVVAKTKTLTTDSFDPFGEIFFWNTTTTYPAGANVGDGSWYRQYLCDLRYSFNCGGYNADGGGTLTARLSLYLVAVPQTDGTAVLHSEPLSQTLPNLEDGLIYIYLGRVYQDSYPYRVLLSLNHPVYYYKNGAIRLWISEQDPIFSASPAAGITSANITSWNGKVDKVTSTDNAVVRFDGTSGAIQNSGVTINDSNHVTAAKFITSGGTSSQFVKGDGSLTASVKMNEMGWIESNSFDLTSLTNIYHDVGANVFAFYNPNFISIEYTNDGTTWLDYQATETQKINWCTLEGTFYAGKKSDSTSDILPNYAVRATISAGGGVYAHCRFLIVRTWTPSDCSLKVEYTTYAEPTTFIEHTIVSNLTRNPGYIVISFNKYIFGNNDVHDLRITLTYYGGTSYLKNPRILGCIRAYCDNVYSANSDFAKTGHLYTITANKKAKFPEDVEAKKFVKTGGTSAQFLKADGSVDSTSYGTYSKPSGGIPKTDLASAVQTSLGKADSALLSETDPVFSASAASSINSSDIAYWDNKRDKDYLTFEVLESGTINFTPTSGNENILLYSKDNGATWTLGNSVSVVVGDKVMWKGSGSTPVNSSTGGIGTFGDASSTSPVTTIKFKVYGNIMSLVYGDNFENLTEFVGAANFCCLFRETKVTEAHKLRLPNTDLLERCYYKLFMNCTELISMPDLHGIVLAKHCYSKMFSGCTKLYYNIPEVLPITTLAVNCYDGMFTNCSSMVVAPKLPATTLADSCYSAMFLGCSSLEVAPELPAAVFTTTCCWRMFDGCVKINFIKCLATNISASNSHPAWTTNVAATGIFVKADNPPAWPSGVNGIPSGWTSYTESLWKEVRLYALDAKENTSNKVTSLSSSSTDTLYPSAKCVYDLIKDSCVFIEGSDIYLNF